VSLPYQPFHQLHQPVLDSATLARLTGPRGEQSNTRSTVRGLNDLCEVNGGSIFCFWGVSVAAQDTGGVLRGTVRELKGAPSAGAIVEAVNLGTGQNLSTISNEEGSFELRPLMPGEYEVSASGKDYVTDTQRGLKLTGGQGASVTALRNSPAPC
jgi:hypothetical protein